MRDWYGVLTELSAHGGLTQLPLRGHGQEWLDARKTTERLGFVAIHRFVAPAGFALIRLGIGMSLVTGLRRRGDIIFSRLSIVLISLPSSGLRVRHCSSFSTLGNGRSKLHSNTRVDASHTSAVDEPALSMLNEVALLRVSRQNVSG